MPSKMLKPQVTEKATDLTALSNAYVFRVPQSANKALVRQEIIREHKVKPVRINIINLPGKKVTSRRGRVSWSSGFKKAVVYLKKGDKITLA